MYEQIKEGKMPEELARAQAQPHTDANGNPIVDEEGGAVIQPKAGFVVKTKDLKSGTKVFVNMTHHEIVEGFQEKRITPEEAAKLDASETGVRIPLSLGDVREDSDKNGNPVQVYDFIFNTETVKTAQKEAAFRQAMVELSFNYVKQKFDVDLDHRFSIPKMKYKGATIEYQRVKAKKGGPKIQEVEMTEEERQRLAERAMEEERRKEALREKEPKWKLFCILDERFNKDFAEESYLQRLVKDAFENDCAGDDKDRWSHLLDNFDLKQQFDVFEEYDGLNSDDASGLMLTVTLPMLARGHSVQCHLLKQKFLQVHVPTLYHLALAFPFPVDETSMRCYFDCKIRRLFVHAVKAAAPAQPAPEAEPEVEVFEEDRGQAAQIFEIDEKADDEEAIEEIDTDVHFGRGTDTGKVQTYFERPATEATKAESKAEPAEEDDDLLYDLC